MKCEIHPLREAVGYCAQCGLIGCEECLCTVGGKKLCIRCARKKAPKPEGPTVSRRPRQRLVVRFKDGFSTITDHVFVVGKKKPELTLPEVSAL